MNGLAAGALEEVIDAGGDEQIVVFLVEVDEGAHLSTNRSEGGVDVEGLSTVAEILNHTLVVTALSLNDTITLLDCETDVSEWVGLTTIEIEEEVLVAV